MASNTDAVPLATTGWSDGRLAPATGASTQIGARSWYDASAAGRVYAALVGYAPSSDVAPPATENRTGRLPWPTAAVAVQTSACTASRACSWGSPVGPASLSSTVIRPPSTVTPDTVVSAQGRRTGCWPLPVAAPMAAVSAACARCAGVAPWGTGAVTNSRNRP